MSLFRRNKGVREGRDEAAAAEPGLSAAAEAPTVEQTPESSGGGFAAPEERERAERAELDALVGEAPSSRRRGRLRRRLRHLRRVREVLLRDLGGLTFELHRRGAGEGGDVLQGKLARLGLVDREIRVLEDQLSDHRAMIVREPGIGGTCGECGELFGSEARYCWACGNPVAAGAGRAPHLLAGWSTHPQLAAGADAPPAAAPAAPGAEAAWPGRPGPDEHPTAPVPQMDPQTAAGRAEPAAPGEPATGDVGSEGGAAWTSHAVEGSAVEELPTGDPSSSGDAPPTSPRPDR